MQLDPILALNLYFCQGKPTGLPITLSRKLTFFYGFTARP